MPGARAVGSDELHDGKPKSPYVVVNTEVEAPVTCPMCDLVSNAPPSRL